MDLSVLPHDISLLILDILYQIDHYSRFYKCLSQIYGICAHSYWLWDTMPLAHTQPYPFVQTEWTFTHGDQCPLYGSVNVLSNRFERRTLEALDDVLMLYDDDIDGPMYFFFGISDTTWYNVRGDICGSYYERAPFRFPRLVGEESAI